MVSISSNCDLAEIKRILDTDPECLDHRWGNLGTMLHIATRNERLDAVEFLIEQGADVDKLDNSGMSAIDVVSYSGDSSVEILRALLNAGCSIFRYFARGKNAFGAAAAAGSIEALDLMLNADRDAWQLYWLDDEPADVLAERFGSPEAAAWLRQQIRDKPRIRWKHFELVCDDEAQTRFRSLADEFSHLVHKVIDRVDVRFENDATLRGVRVANGITLGIPEEELEHEIVDLGIPDDVMKPVVERRKRVEERIRLQPGEDHKYTLFSPDDSGMGEPVPAFLHLASNAGCRTCGRDPCGERAFALVKVVAGQENFRVGGVCAQCASGRTEGEISELLENPPSAPVRFLSRMLRRLRHT